jgi:choline kinase
MVPIAGRPLLHRTVATLNACGISDVAVIRGYAEQSVHAPGVRYVSNKQWADTNVLGSLFSAQRELSRDVLIVYGDILVSEGIVRAALTCNRDIVPVADVSWRDAYLGRALHPLDEAEKVTIKAGRIERIGKRNIAVSDADAEFVGVLRLSADGVARLKAAHALARKSAGQGPFVTANSFAQAYLTDLLQFMIDRGEHISAALISGGWREIDTPEDLARAEQWVQHAAA